MALTKKVEPPKLGNPTTSNNSFEDRFALIEKDLKDLKLWSERKTVQLD
jgi:hypothetical protein